MKLIDKRNINKTTFGELDIGDVFIAGENICCMKTSLTLGVDGSSNNTLILVGGFAGATEYLSDGEIIYPVNAELTISDKKNDEIKFYHQKINLEIVNQKG